MKLIVMFMVILLSFCPIVTTHEEAGRTVPPHRLITEAATAGRKQVETTETIIAADVTVESEAGKEDEVISQSPAHEHTWTLCRVDKLLQYKLQDHTPLTLDHVLTSSRKIVFVQLCGKLTRSDECVHYLG